MKNQTQPPIARALGILVLGLLSTAVAANAATTNLFVFNDTVLSPNVGPNNPANGPMAFYGTNLALGDVVVFDGIIINSNPGANDGAWGAVDLNGSGTGGVTGASLGVLVRDGTAAGNYCQMWVNAGGLGNFGNAPGSPTNRCRIEVTCTEAGSTTNMNYLVEIDQGLTGAFNATQSGTGVNFPNNAIPLTFGTRNQTQTFIQNQPVIRVAAPTPGTNSVVLGFTATFNGSITGGFPRSAALQWLSNGVPIPNATNLSYTTPPTVASYNGARYSLIVSNQLNPTNVLTSPTALLLVRSTPGIVTLNFPTTTVAGGYGAVTDPGVAISGTQLLAGDTVVFDGIVTPNGAQSSDAWTAINVAGSGYGNVTSAKLGVLCRLGTGPSQLFINGGGSTNPTAGGALTNRVRIELYPSANGSTTNMGWLVEIDQNLSGTFQPAVTGTNLTFINNTLPLTFGSSFSSSFVTQNPQSPVSIFAGPSPAFQVVAAGAPVSVGVTVMGWSPAFQWRKNGTPILNATNRTYTLASAALADNGDQFTVVVSNRLNSLNVITSAVASVSVLIPNNLSWYPAADGTTWDTTTPNWTTNGGVSQTRFSSGNNVTFDSLGFNLPGGTTITTTNAVSPNGVTVNATGGVTALWAGSGSVSGQSLFLTGDQTGTLALQAPATFANAAIDIGSTLNIGYGGVNGMFQANVITNNGSIGFYNDTDTQTIGARLAGSGSVSQYGSGTTILSAVNSVYSIGIISGGTLSIACGPTGIIVNNAVLEPNSTVDMSITNYVTGVGHFFFTGFQTTTLTGVSDQSGRNQIQWSKVVVDNPQALGDTANGSTFCSGADNVGGLYLSNNVTWLQPLALNPRQGPPSSSATAPHLANLAGTNDVSCPLTFEVGQGGSELNVETMAGQLTIDSVVGNSASSTNNLNLQGAGVGIWNGALSDGADPTVDILSVVKRGAGTWALNGMNTYGGQTTVSGGTLLINGQIAAGDVSVLSGGTLGGSGIIGGAVTVATGGTLSPGPGIGTLTINNTLTLAPGSFARMEISKTGATNDLITGVTALTYGGTLVVSNVSGSLTTSDSFKLFSASSYSGSFAGVSPATPGSGLAWDTSTLAADGTLRIKTGVDTTPFSITPAVVGGNTLRLSWPTSHIGWTIEVQTNSPSAGLGTNWVRLPASSSVSQMDMTIIRTNGSVFFRMVYP